MKNRPFRNSENIPIRGLAQALGAASTGNSGETPDAAPASETDDDPDDEDAAVASVEDWLDELDPDDLEVVDPVELRQVGLAQTGIEQAEAELRAAVKTARTAGQSWAAIGRTLGISRQAAHERFGRRDLDFDFDSDILYLQVKQPNSNTRASIEEFVSKWLHIRFDVDRVASKPVRHVTIIARDHALTVHYDAEGHQGTVQDGDLLDNTEFELIGKICAQRADS